MTDARAAFSKSLPYVAEIGDVAYGSLCAVIIACAVAEFLAPGIIAAAVSPQALALAAFAAGALSLVSERKVRPSRRRRAFYGAAGAAASVFAFSSAWYYFVSVPDARAPLAWASGMIVAIMFLACA